MCSGNKKMNSNNLKRKIDKKHQRNGVNGMRNALLEALGGKSPLIFPGEYLIMTLVWVLLSTDATLLLSQKFKDGRGQSHHDLKGTKL